MKAIALFYMLFRYYAALRARVRQRNELRGLDDRMLRDIGLTREEAMREASKPIWKL